MFKKLVNSFLSQETLFYTKLVGSLFERDLENDLKISLKQHPNDDFGRSIAQHKCQVYPFKKEVFLLNSMAMILTPVVMLALLFKKRTTIKDDLSAIVCYYCFNLPGSLPEALQDKRISYLTSEECTYYLRMTDVLFLIRFFIRSFWHPFLAFRVMLKVAKYRAIIDSFIRLEIIAITGEFVDTSSAMTQYCHERGILHYDFMQGEAFGSPRASFFHFDKCFVWDQHYVDLFVSLGACSEQFVISLPQCLHKIEGEHANKTIDYTYYLGGGSDDELPIIRKALDTLASKGYICEIRPHPRWSNMEEINKVFKGISIQDTKSVSISQSILQTKNAISLYSTVLLQAFYNDVHVVIDNISNPEKFKMLEGYKYIMLNKPHILLSEITKS